VSLLIILKVKDDHHCTVLGIPLLSQ